MRTTRHQDANGFALIFAIWVLAIMMIAVTVFARNEMEEINISQLALDHISARFLAEGGVERGIAELKASYSADTPSRRAWVSDDRDFGSTWARLGSYTCDANYTTSNLAATWGGASLQYYLPSQRSAYTTGDIGYFQVAVEDESGKVNLNSAAPELVTMLDVGSYHLGSAVANNIMADRPYRTVWDIARASGVNYATSFFEKRYLAVYPNVGSWLGIPQDNSGALNVNSAYYDGAGRGPLNAIRVASVASGDTTFVTAAQRDALFSYRRTNPIDDTAEFTTAIGGGYVPAPGAVRFDSAGYYRIIARGVTLASDGTTKTGEAMVDATLKATFALDKNPVTIVAWSEWWEIY